LTQVVENHNAVEQWKQTFTYDRYGNRTVVTGQTTPSMVGPNPVINQANNQIVQQQGEQYAYDLAGNLTVDQTGKKFTFDGENKVVTYFADPNAPTAVTAEYRYDADGKRVKKIVGNVTTLFVYDAIGKMIAEYSINAPQPEPRTQYLTADKLSSQRVISDGQGAVTSRRDFSPFGEELLSNPTNRQTSVGYASTNDKTKQKFATYERDDESGLDFAKARMFKSSIGRFISADPLMKSGRMENPQTWNRYVYCLNNPVINIDPDGEDYFYVEGKWVWSNSKTYTYTDKNGKKQVVKQGYEYLLVYVRSTQKNNEGASQGVLLLFKQNQIIAAAGVFSGGKGTDIGDGNFKINLAKVSTFTERNLVRTRDGVSTGPMSGVQHMPEHFVSTIPDGKKHEYDLRGPWGKVRLQLENMEGRKGPAYNLNYLHGKNDPDMSTHGCICDRNYGVIDAILKIDNKTNKILPVVVETGD
jgi:RHS repeat-associated protein